MKLSLRHQKGNTETRAFTLLELLVSMAILSILMLGAAEVFTKSFSSFRSTRSLETSIADAQFLMNLIAKELRTSSIILPASSGSVQTVKFYEYSKQECVQYRFSGTLIEVARQSTTFSGCDTGSNLSGFTTLSVGSVTGSFVVVPSEQGSPHVGKVTMMIVIATGGGDPIVLETTTSLRDYGYIWPSS